MFKCFEVEISEKNRDWLENYLAEHKRNPIEKIVTKDDMESALKSSSANWLMDTWFKDYSADVFISHATKDLKLAEGLAALLESAGMRVFIDSDVWGRVERLQHMIDDAHAAVKDENGNVSHYLYEKRNNTTGCVHAMLHFALMRMINQTECFMFLSTSNSKISSTGRMLETKSPWLFHELAVANYISEGKPKRPRMGVAGLGLDAGLETIKEAFSVKFSIEKKRLRQLELISVYKMVEENKREAALNASVIPQFTLDRLYRLSAQ